MKLLVALLASALVVAAACSESALPTAASPGLQLRPDAVVMGGCPTPFTLAGMIVGNADARAADNNGDGYACYLTERETVVAWTDNNVPLSQIGGCPNGFNLVGVPMHEEGANTGDANGDGLICTRTAGNGSTIVLDNNHRP